MKDILLLTHAATKASIMRGILLLDDSHSFVTLEPPWADNEPLVSCIPPGSYISKRVHKRETIGGSYIEETFEITDVVSRSGILIHVGNTEIDTHGCILIGRDFTDINGKSAIRDSRKAFKDFLSLLSGIEEFRLTINRGYYAGG